MNKYFGYYNNRHKNPCNVIPSKQQLTNYLIKENYLSEYSTEEEINEVLNNLTILQKLKTIVNLINAKVIEVGGVLWDLVPTEGHTDYVLSSDTLYNLMQNYYNKNDIDNKITQLWQLWIDNYNQSSEPLQPLLISGENIKTINGQSVLGEGNIDISYPEVSEEISGLMTPQLYKNLSNLSNTIVPKIQTDISELYTILGINTLESSDIIEKYQKLLEFIQSLDDGDEGQEMLNSIIENISEIKNDLQSEIERSSEQENRISILEKLYEDISVISSAYSIVTELEPGLMSSQMLITLNSLSSNYDTILNDVSEIKEAIQLDDIAIIEKFNRIAEFLEQIKSSEEGQEILDNIIEILNDEKNRAQSVEKNLQSQINKLNTLVQKNELDIKNLGKKIINGGDNIQHIILTQSQYDSLESYENNAIYFIIENISWTFGDKFPIIFGENNTESNWTFGDKFPIIFEGSFSRFGGVLPFTLT